MPRSTALALFALAAPAVAAQPTAADSALVERTVAALRLDRSAEALSSMGVPPVPPDAPPEAAAALDEFTAAVAAVDLEAVADSVRAAFYADLRPAALGRALGYLEGPAPDVMLDRVAPLAPTALDSIAALVEDPGGRPLADSALAARLVSASFEAAQPPEVREMLAEANVEAMRAAMPPEMWDEMEEVLGPDGFDQLVEMATDPEIVSAALAVGARANRVLLGGVDRSVLEETVAYYESDAGRYVSRVSAIATLRAMLPTMTAAMTNLWRTALDPLR